jgi:hypothetical protein
MTPGAMERLPADLPRGRSAVKRGEVDAAQALWVGDRVDLGDLAMFEGEAQLTDEPSMRDDGDLRPRSPAPAGRTGRPAGS